MSPLITTETSPLLNVIQRALSHPSSRFFTDEHLVNSNIPLAEEDINLVESGKSALLESLDALSEGFQHISALLSVLADQHTQVEKAFQCCFQLVAPIRRLPAEVLQIIFCFVRQAEGPLDGSPTVVSQVCGFWRQIALATPSLWRTIVIPLSHRNIPTRLDHLDVRMERCKGRQITLVLGEDTEICRSVKTDRLLAEERSVGIALAQALEPHGCGIESLVIRGGCEVGILAFFQTWGNSASFFMENLRTFKISWDIWWCRREDWPSVKGFLCQKAPRLENVSMDSDAAGRLAMPPSTKAFCGNIDGDVLRALFTTPNNIEVLELRYFCEWEVFRPGPPVFQHLTSLHLAGAIFPTPSHHVPPLHTLRHLILSHADEDYDTAHLRPILEAWGPQLTYLSLMIDAEDISLEELEKVLSLASNLEALRLGSSNYVDMVKPSRFPRLAHCEFHFDKFCTESVASLKKFSMHVRAGTFRRFRTLGLSHRVVGVTQKAHTDLEETTASLEPVLGKSNIRIKKVRGWVGDFKFDGPYFEKRGGVFENLYLFDSD